MSNNSNKGLYYNFILEPLGMYSAGSDESVSQMSAAFGVRSAINDLARFNPKLGQILQKAGYDKIQFTDLLPPIQEQFKNTQNFQIVSFDQTSGFDYLPIGYLSQLKSKYSNESFMLIDTSLRIRNTYKHDMDAVRKMIEHIAIVIPRVKESDIKMKQ